MYIIHPLTVPTIIPDEFILICNVILDDDNAPKPVNQCHLVWEVSFLLFFTVLPIDPSNSSSSC